MRGEPATVLWLSCKSFVWYAHLTPIAIVGSWPNLLVPSTSMFAAFLHNYFAMFVLAITGSNRLMWRTLICLVVAIWLIEILLGNYPAAEMIGRFGLANYLGMWEMIVIQSGLAPLGVGILLARSDRLAPNIFRKWGRALAE